MAIKVGINGFGRIGRQVLRIAENDPAVEVVAINSPSGPEPDAHLFKYDSVHGRFDGVVEATEDAIVVNGRRIPIIRERGLENLPWGEYDVEIVVECTGFYNDGDKARAHIENGAKRVLIAAPATNPDLTVVWGVNHELYDPEQHFVVSNASCTTNCLGPFAKVLHDNFGIVRGFMNTIHAYTNDQRILDGSHRDLRRARSAAQSIIPTSTGAAKAIGIVMPELKGKLDGMSMRVPTQDGSVVDLVCELSRPVTRDEINDAMRAASEGEMKGILEYCTDPIVSIDVVGNPASSVFDSLQTMVMDGEGTFVKCIAWYDNEWGYSSRLVDMIKYMAA